MACSSVSAIRAKALALFVLIAAAYSISAYAALPARAARDRSRSEKAQKPLQYEISVSLKLIQVFVAGPDGNPAVDLEMADFVLYDDGKLQEITDFEKHLIQTPEAAAAPSPLMKRKYILLFDNDSNDLAGIAKSRKAALEFLDNNVQMGDEVAFFSCSPAPGLTVHEYFTSDHHKIREAINGRPRRGPLFRATRRLSPGPPAVFGRIGNQHGPSLVDPGQDDARKRREKDGDHQPRPGR